MPFASPTMAAAERPRRTVTLRARGSRGAFTRAGASQTQPRHPRRGSGLHRPHAGHGASPAFTAALRPVRCAIQPRAGGKNPFLSPAFGKAPPGRRAGPLRVYSGSKLTLPWGVHPEFRSFNSRGKVSSGKNPPVAVPLTPQPQLPAQERLVLGRLSSSPQRTPQRPALGSTEEAAAELQPKHKASSDLAEALRAAAPQLAEQQGIPPALRGLTRSGDTF